MVVDLHKMGIRYERDLMEPSSFYLVVLLKQSPQDMPKLIDKSPIETADSEFYGFKIHPVETLLVSAQMG